MRRNKIRQPVTAPPDEVGQIIAAIQSIYLGRVPDPLWIEEQAFKAIFRMLNSAPFNDRRRDLLNRVYIKAYEEAQRTSGGAGEAQRQPQSRRPATEWVPGPVPKP